MANVGDRLTRLVLTLFTAFAVLAAGVPAVLAGPAAWAQLTGRTRLESLAQGALLRHYRVHRPAASAPHPGLVVSLSGAGLDGFAQEATSGFDAQVDRLGWIVAYPDPVGTGWDAFGCCPHRGADDVAFVAAVVERPEASDGVDPRRVYVTGISRGAMMAYRLACELSSRVAAIAPVEGNMADAGGSADAVACAPTRPVSLLVIHGTADSEIPVDGGRSRVHVESIAYAPLPDVVRRWRGLDGCAAGAAETSTGAAAVTTWSCGAGSTVEMVLVNGAGHTWPGALIFNPPGSAAAGVDASRLIADFFASRPGAPS